jgi:hypothetical protein
MFGSRGPLSRAWEPAPGDRHVEPQAKVLTREEAMALIAELKEASGLTALLRDVR